MNENPIIAEIRKSVENSDVNRVRELLLKYPEFLHHDHGVGTWLHAAAYEGSIEMVALLLDLGLDVNAEWMLGGSAEIPLDLALGKDNPRLVELLLQRGANPNYHKQIIEAIVGSGERSLEMVQLLEAYGADLHRIFDNKLIDEPMNALSSAIDWGKDNVAEYLRSRGCVLPSEERPSARPRIATDEVVRYFEEHFGPVGKQSLTEIVLGDPPIAIHVVHPTTARLEISRN